MWTGLYKCTADMMAGKSPFTAGKRALWAVEEAPPRAGTKPLTPARVASLQLCQPFSRTAREPGRQKVGRGHWTHPQVPEYPEHVTLQCHGRPSVPWAVAQSQNRAKLLWTLILDVWNVKEIWININPLSKSKVSTPAQSDGKENLSAERLGWYVWRPKVRVQRQFEKIKEPSKGKLSPFHVLTDDGNRYYLRACII